MLREPTHRRADPPASATATNTGSALTDSGELEKNLTATQEQIQHLAEGDTTAIPPRAPRAGRGAGRAVGNSMASSCR